MTSHLLRAAAKPILFWQLLLAFYLLLRGHNMPGGGFSAGLLAAAGFCLHAVAFGTGSTAAIRRLPRALTGVGLLIAAASGFAGPWRGEPFMTAAWGPTIGAVKIGTPLLFDIGVFLTVFGMTWLIITTLFAQDEVSS